MPSAGLPSIEFPSTAFCVEVLPIVTPDPELRIKLPEPATTPPTVVCPAPFQMFTAYPALARTVAPSAATPK